jgi:two-component system, OmpR family, response regulator VicR
MNILVCEDNKLALKVLKVVLEKDGYQVFTANDGNEAYELINQRDYDLILIDIHLPFHSGLELVQHLRQELKKNTPVIIVSAFSDRQVQKQAKDLGVDDYFVKPINANDLLNRINYYLRNGKS